MRLYMIAGQVTMIAAVVSAFLDIQTDSLLARFLFLSCGVACLLLVALDKWTRSPKTRSTRGKLLLFVR